MKFKAIFGHFKTILIHKHWVFYYARKLGIPWQGFWHDLSKFSPTEFWESVEFYQGGKSSPIPAAKKEQGYSLAWQHHKGRNPHHYEYWTDNYDAPLGITCIKVPWKYMLEMVADYLAAGRTYRGESFTFASEYRWWLRQRDLRKMHPDTKAAISTILFFLRYHGLEALTKEFLKERKLEYEK